MRCEQSVGRGVADRVVPEANIDCDGPVNAHVLDPAQIVRWQEVRNGSKSLIELLALADRCNIVN